jgi:hypothetical protein
MIWLEPSPPADGAGTSMNLKLITFGLATVLATLVIAKTIVAEEERTIEISVGDEVPLTAIDLDQITAQVLAENPLLSSSPGIKFASAQRSVRSVDIAGIIYFPHSETAGFKRAFQVDCERQVPVESWTCGEARIRAYLKLETQDFEVRVRGGIGSDQALALIAATRHTIHSSAIEDSVMPETAVMIWPYRDRFHVSWGSPEGYQELIMEVHLREDGDPANPDDWQADVYRPSN